MREYSNSLVLFLVGWVLLLTSCQPGRQDNLTDKNHGTPISATGTEVEIKFARGFSITRHEKFKLVKVYNPWEEAENIVFKYVLADDRQFIPESISNDYYFIKTPINRIICLSTTHVAMVEKLDKENTIIGISGIDYIYSPKINERIKQNLIFDIGFDHSLNYELIIRQKPDLVMAYSISGNNSYIRKLEDFGLNVVFNGEFLEKSPLAKAEWIKFVAAFYNLEGYAEEVFDEVVNEYNALKSRVAGLSEKPVVMTALPWKDAWNVPSGNSFAAKFIADAGGEYLWAGYLGQENFPLDIETVFLQAAKADIWINTGSALSKKDITGVDVRLARLDAFKNGNIYNNNARLSGLGGSDYWESGVVSPHLIIKDLIHIFHPSINEHHELYYYRKIE